MPAPGHIFSLMKKTGPMSASIPRNAPAIPCALANLCALTLLTVLGASPAAALVSAAPRDTTITFKDPRPFKCVCYSGYRDGQAPGQSEPNEAQVREDLVLVKKYAHEIRTYGSGKGTHGHFVPTIADELGLTVHLGVWVDATYPDETNLAAVNDAIALINQGHKSIKSVIVGNEYMLRVRHPEITPTPHIKPDPVLSEAKLLDWIKKVKAGIPKGVEVTTADTWHEMNANGDALLSELDFITWHLHPWWEDQHIDNAVAYLATRHKAVTDRMAKFPGKRIVLGETGWPTLAAHGAAVGSPENQSRYFKELTAWGFHNGAEFWSFSAFDENWKNAEGAVGGHWGFWYANRQPLPIISGLDALFPRYMWSENPGLTTGTHPPHLRAVRPAAAASAGTAVDALGRPAETLSGKTPYRHGRVLTPSNGSRGLFILAP